MNILKKADEIVNQRSEERTRQYGKFSECMERATAIFNAMSPEGEFLTPEGMYRAMIAMKFARQANAHKEDNLLDAAAYIGALNNYIEERNAYEGAQKIGYNTQSE